jgi:F-type H+-transporting ATPase subunit b
MLLLVSGEWMEWFDYPGLELWKFLNLAIFTAGAIYVLRRPISQALLARREAIRQELLAAQNEHDVALAKLADAESMLSRLDDEIRVVHEQARKEAESERQRLAASTAREIEKLKQQALREMETADKLARKDLRQYLAKRSVEMARESVRSQMRPEDDTHLIKENIGELRRTTV